MKVPSERESLRDEPPDKPSAAQPASGVPASGSHSVQGKRSLPVPSKVKGGLQAACGCGGTGPGGQCVRGACLSLEVTDRKVETWQRGGGWALWAENSRPPPPGSSVPWFCLSPMGAAPCGSQLAWTRWGVGAPRLRPSQARRRAFHIPAVCCPAPVAACAGGSCRKLGPAADPAVWAGPENGGPCAGFSA